LARQAHLTPEERSALARLHDELEQLPFFHSNGSFNSEAYQAAKHEEKVWSQVANKKLSRSDIKTLLDHTTQLLASLKKLP
jgi:Ser/Thr protein kinase RdoA (MazF antagonist)